MISLTVMQHLKPGDVVPSFSVKNLRGDDVIVPSPSATLVHLQFRRFAGCPVCNLHLRSVARRHGEIVAAGVREVAVFHSEAATMMPYQGDLPFDVVADPTKALYRLYGVEASMRSVLDPRSWGALMKGMIARHPFAPFRGEGGHLGLPADFIIDTNSGRVLEAKYGVHADDQWSVDELLALAAAHPRLRTHPAAA